MDREIKFRGKRIDNGEWVYGYYAKDMNYSGFNEFEYVECIIDTTKGPSEGMWFEVDPSTVGQYTGLKDSRGVEIYEGDIFLTGTDVVAIVEWEEEGRFLGFTFGGERMIVYINRQPVVKKIGNIYDNPELLEVK